MEPKAKITVYELKFNKTSNAKKHNNSEYMIKHFYTKPIVYLLVIVFCICLQYISCFN